ncbi:MAG: hypothetical protein GX640_10400, partial [Fibrobacter sp.]|nr:hypothetical protein [Fibrobacter sp.]
NLFFIGSYALNPFNKLSIGVNANIAYQGNFGAPGWGFGFDAGISYRLLYDPYFGHHIIGIAYKNLFSPFGNGKISMPYSSQIKMQYHVSFFRNRFNFDYQIAFNDLNSKNSFFVNGSKKIDWDMGFQIGAEVIKNLRITAIADLNQETKLSSFGLVAGMDLQKLKNSRNLSFSYQYLQNLKTDLIGMHSLYTAARMGIHREQIFARNMAHKAQYIISDMYTKAMQQYFSGQYWESYFNFSRLLIDNPEFFKNDAVAFYAASCLEKLDMRQQALRCYQELKKQFTESSYISLADLGMMRILYREGRFADVEKKFTDILADSSVVDSIKQYATYYMGETELLQGNYGAASEYLSQIEQDHSLYGFAQHSMATVAEFLGKDKDSIRQYLFNVVESAQVNNPAQKEILNRSLVLLGYLYYEENLMSKAVVALRMVSKDSYFYEDAMLGLGWAAVKAKQWDDCIEAGKALASVSKKEIILSEASLLQAYGYLQKKQYDTAENLLTGAMALIETYDDSISGRVLSKALKYDRNRILYDSIAEQYVQIAGAKLWEIDSDQLEILHEDQMIIKSNIDKSLRAADEYKRTRFFERSLTRLKEDIEYALATVQRIHRSVEIEEADEEQKIENKIKELQKKMKKSEME